jgi:site-specific recombinase XerD
MTSFRLIHTPDLQHRYQVVRPDGLPDIPLTLFANDQRTSLSESSIKVYVRELLTLHKWLLEDCYTSGGSAVLLSSAEQVRMHVGRYLAIEAHCKVMKRPDNNGLKVVFIKQTDGTKINVRILLSALKRFYESLISCGYYHERNPFIHEGADVIATQVRRQYREAVKAFAGRPPMPAVSGIDPPSGIRLSANYFRLIQREWTPKTIDDPDFPVAVHNAGKQYGWGLREQCIVRTMFEAGPRISEIVGLTVRDWAESLFLNRFSAKSKGSHGLRVKHLVVSMTTAKMYRRYFDDANNGRLSNDLRSLRLSDVERMYRQNPGQVVDIPLFLTSRGTPMTATHFRDYYWSPALRAAGIDADPHLARHWFVTNALRNIESAATDEVDLRRKKLELIEYMKWRTGERTLKVYEHVRREHNFLKRLNSIHREMATRERTFKSMRNKKSLTNIVSTELPATDRNLAFILGDDDEN